MESKATHEDVKVLLESADTIEDFNFLLWEFKDLIIAIIKLSVSKEKINWNEIHENLWINWIIINDTELPSITDEDIKYKLAKENRVKLKFLAEKMREISKLAFEILNENNSK
jgi:hypothetical protein